MIDTQAIAADLEALARARVPLIEAIPAKAAYLLSMPRYAGEHGPETVATDIAHAVGSLPDERRYTGSRSARPIRKDATTLLLPESPYPAWSARTNAFAGLGGGDYGSQSWYARCLLLEVAGILAAKHAATSEAFQWLEYKWQLTLDEEDPRRHTDKRIMRIRALLPHQVVVPLRHFYDGDPPAPAIEVTSPNHRYIGRLPAQEVPWWDNFISIDNPYEPGDEFTLTVVTKYRDESEFPQGSGELAYVARSPALRRLDLAVRLPPPLATTARGEWQIILNPHVRAVVRDRGEVKPVDGWHRHVFERPEGQVEHRLAFPGLDPYAPHQYLTNTAK